MLQWLRIHIKIMEAVDTTVEKPNIAAEKDAVHNAEEIGGAVVVTVSTMI